MLLLWQSSLQAKSKRHAAGPHPLCVASNNGWALLLPGETGRAVRGTEAHAWSAVFAVVC